MRSQSPATKALFSQAERNEIVSTESRLLSDAKNGNFSPLFEFWTDKKERMLQRSNEISERTEYWARKTGVTT